MFEYTTEQPLLILKEYGRNVQKLAAYIRTIEDREKRTRFAELLTDLMRQIHPGMRDAQDYSNKLWDDLYNISGFDLDVDSPYPMPEKDLLGKQPQRVPYNTHQLAYRHYGKNVELMIEKAVAMTDPEERESALIYIGRLMKTFYAAWNKENVDDAVIVQHLKEMSKGELTISVERVKNENLFDGFMKEGRTSPDNGNNNRNKNQNNKKQQTNRKGDANRGRRKNQQSGQ